MDGPEKEEEVRPPAEAMRLDLLPRNCRLHDCDSLVSVLNLGVDSTIDLTSVERTSMAGTTPSA